VSAIALVFFVSDCPNLRYNVSTIPPSDVMPLNWHNLKLDEQFFQSVLSAAFTIQEHNDRGTLARQTPARQTPAETEAYPEPEAKSQWITAAAEELTPGDPTPDGAEPAVQPFERPASIDADGASTKLLQCVPDHLLREIVRQALQATRASGAAIALEQQGALVCRAAAGDFASEIDKMINTRSGFTGVCTSSGTTQLCNNTTLDSRGDADECRKLGVSALIVVPLFHQDQLLGWMAVFSRRPYAFGMRDLQALQGLAEKFAANLQLSAKSGKANTGPESPGRL
jgi:GAF domain-containing protein